MSGLEGWQAAGAIAGIGTVVIGGLGLMGGFFGWLSKQFAKINDHLGKQDIDIAQIQTDMRWVKGELEKKQDKEES